MQLNAVFNYFICSQMEIKYIVYIRFSDSERLLLKKQVIFHFCQSKF